MPLYMDRHDVSDQVTAEMVAQLHQQDLKIQDQFGCRGLTYWFDDKRKTAFCLIEAVDREAIIEMHNKAHGEVPHQVIEVDPNVVESFLGRIEDPQKTKDTVLNIISDPAFRTIMVLKFEPGAGSKNEKYSTLPSLRFRDNIIDCVRTANGNLVSANDDGFLFSFRSVSDAVLASINIRTSIYETGKKVLNPDTCLKTALTAGVPVTEKKEIFEDTIRLAERMCQSVKGEIIISSEVKNLYNSENAKPLREGKGIRCLTATDEIFLNLLFDMTELSWRNPTFKIDDLNRLMGYSRSQLYRNVILLTGESPNAFIRQYRLSQAVKLLRKGVNNVSEVAFETGFTTQSYFSKCFQKQYGYLPSSHLAVTD